MAFNKRGGSSRPKYSVATSVFVRKGKYLKGPTFGLWLADNGPMARGSVKDEYLEDLISFLQKAAKNEMSVSFALFKNQEKKDDDDEGEYRSRRSREEEDEDDKPARRKRREEPEEEEDEKPAKRKSKKSEEEEEEDDKPAKKSKGKKDDWDFDD